MLINKWVQVGLSVGIGSIIITGCTVTPNPQAIGPYPSRYKEIVKSYVEQTYFDPYSMRSVEISTPVQGYIFFQQGWIVCLQNNAKNRMGGYIGLKKTAFLINHDRITQQLDNMPLCNELELSPWPELEGR